MLACMANGGLYGVRRSLWGMVGATLGNLALMLLSAAGMGLLLTRSDALFNAIRWLGAAYLVWLGLKICLQPVVTALTARLSTAGSPRALLTKSFIIAASNPKGLIYFGALLPQFISPEQPLVAQFTILTVVFVVMDLLWMLAYAKGGNFIMSWLRSPTHQRWFNWVCGGALVAMGVLMALMKS